jgi:hypothetical protein
MGGQLSILERIGICPGEGGEALVVRVVRNQHADTSDAPIR